AAYNAWPKSYLLTGTPTGHGPLTSIVVANKPAFYYSLACDHGGFDFDAPPIQISGRTVCQELCSQPDGAVGFVAYSRWGWVNSSYRLQKAFFDSLFAHPDRPASAAMFASKLTFDYHRDLVYGQNYYGDPTVRVYTRQPKELTLSFDVSTGVEIVTVTDNTGPVAGVMVALSREGVLLETGVSDAAGQVHLATPIEPALEYTVTASGEGYVVRQTRLHGSIVTSVDDDEDILPHSFELAQNYPNPFNPTTTIAFDLPERAVINLSIYNLLGQKVTTLAQGAFPGGHHTVTWEPDATVASGVYFYRLRAGAATQVRKMVLMK
ncbi:MAG: T9SS C-terminal target domain-containing protein, partial [Candidatus Zixiibacteriota bacterium]